MIIHFDIRRERAFQPGRTLVLYVQQQGHSFLVYKTGYRTFHFLVRAGGLPSELRRQQIQCPHPVAVALGGNDGLSPDN